MDSTKIFGVRLADVMSRPLQKNIPSVLRDLIALIAKTGLQKESIFKLSPSLDAINRVKADIDSDNLGDQSIQLMDAHMAAALIKTYLAELPGSLLVHDLYPSFISNADNVAGLRALVQKKLPNANKRLAEVLFSLLGMVLDNIQSNKVTPPELSMLFASLVLKPQEETPSTLNESRQRSQVVLNMILHADKIFPSNLVKKTLIQQFEVPEISNQRVLAQSLKAQLAQELALVRQELSKMNQEVEKMASQSDYTDYTQLEETLDQLYSQSDSSLIPRGFHAPTFDGYIPRHIPTVVRKTTLESGHTSLQGPRPTMEDRVEMYDDLNERFQILSAQTNRSYYAVFDGHAGDESSHMASEIVGQCIVTEATFTSTDQVTEALKTGLVKADAKIVDKANELGWTAGTTAVIVVIIGETLYSSNLGDSEAVICVNKGSTRTAISLVDKHKPSDDRERDRIIALGAPVFRGRIFGKLAVSRALGDAEYKLPRAKANFVSNEAYTQQMELTPSHEFIILACDGLWDKVTHQESVDFVHEQLGLGKDVQTITGLLAQHALDRGSKDNVTVVIVLLNWRPIPQ